MTWVVGINSLFGYSFLYSDIQVTCTVNGKNQFYDCCQKIYPLGNFIVGGFAGSIELGFKSLQRIRDKLSVAPQNCAWELETIATEISNLIKQEFESADALQKSLGCQILLQSAHPTKNRGDAPWAWTQTVKFSYPDFLPEFVEGQGVLSIGSGSQIFKDRIENAGNDFKLLMGIASAGIQVQCSVYANIIETIYSDNPQPGISPCYQGMIIGRNQLSFGNHVKRTFEDNGNTTETFFPKRIAQSYPELLAILQDKGINAQALSANVHT